MLTKNAAKQIVRKRLGGAFEADGFKWASAAYGFLRRRERGADGFAVPQVDYGDEQKTSFVMVMRFDRVEDIRAEALGEPPDPWRWTFATGLDWFEERRYVEWTRGSPEALEAAIDELLATYKLRILEHWARYAEPVNVLLDAGQRRGPVEFLRPETIPSAITVLVLHWLHQRDGFDARLASYRERLAGANPAVVAPLERVVTWLRNHPEQSATGR